MLSVRGGASLGLGVACDEFVATRKDLFGGGFVPAQRDGGAGGRGMPIELDATAETRLGRSGGPRYVIRDRRRRVDGLPVRRGIRAPGPRGARFGRRGWPLRHALHRRDERGDGLLGGLARGDRESAGVCRAGGGGNRARVAARANPRRHDRLGRRDDGFPRGRWRRCRRGGAGDRLGRSLRGGRLRGVILRAQPRRGQHHHQAGGNPRSGQ